MNSALDTSKLLNAIDREGMTPLHVAVRFNHVDIGKLLIENGANVNACQSNGVTPLHLAARYRMGEAEKLLEQSPFDNLADVSKKGGLKIFGTKLRRENNDSIPLETLTVGYQKEKSLIPSDNIISQKYQMTTILKEDSETKKSDQFVKHKRSNSVGNENENINNNYKTEWSKSIIFLLLLSKANVNVVDQNDATPLHYAAMRGNSKAVQELLTHPFLNIEV